MNKKYFNKVKGRIEKDLVGMKKRLSSLESKLL